MARRKKIKPVRTGGPTKSLYPRGWPGNLRAVLYLNTKRRKERNEEET